MKKGCFRTVLMIVLFAVLLVTLGPRLIRLGMKQIYPQKYTEIVQNNAVRYNLDSQLVYAVIYTESKFRENAVSPAGANGLMQLTEETYDWVRTFSGAPAADSGDIYTPENNIGIGCALLRYLWDYYGSLDVALSAYNAGMGNVSGWLKNKEYSRDGKTLDEIPFPETKKYVERVHRAQDIYRRLYE